MRMSIVLAILVIAIASSNALAQPSSEKVIVRTGLGECPLSIDGSSVNVEALLSNIELRLNDLQLRTAQDPEYRRLTQPLLSEIKALISLFPKEVYLIPVDAEVHRALDPDRFGGVIDKIREESSLEGKFAVLELTVKYDYFTINQLGYILDEFVEIEDKFSAARLLKRNIVDPENAYTIADRFADAENGRTCVEIILFDE